MVWNRVRIRRTRAAHPSQEFPGAVPTESDFYVLCKHHATQIIRTFLVTWNNKNRISSLPKKKVFPKVFSEENPVACVTGVSNRVIARKLEKKGWRVPSFPSPSPVIHFFFCSCPSFLDEPREETLATQAKNPVVPFDSLRRALNLRNLPGRLTL